MTFKNTIWCTLILQGEIVFQCPKNAYFFTKIKHYHKYKSKKYLHIFRDIKGYHPGHTKTVLELIYQYKLVQM